MTLHAQDCYQASILSPAPFLGNDGEIFKLDDGSIWEVKYEYEYLYEYYPSVVICPNRGTLFIDGKSLNVLAISPSKNEPDKSQKAKPENAIIESQMDGDFEGFEGETIFKLMNGQIWRQSEYWYHYHYSYMPRVIIYGVDGGYIMKVEGIEKAIGVEQIR